MSRSAELAIGKFEINEETGKVRFYAHNVADANLGCVLCKDRDTCDRDIMKKCMVWCG